VAFHAIQVLLLQTFNLAFMFVLMTLWFCVIVGTIATSGPKPGGPPPAILLVIPIVWLAFIGEWVFTLVLAIVYAIKAGRGEWASYPVVGGWARRILKI
jgi:uncharacterized membrane protein